MKSKTKKFWKWTNQTEEDPVSERVLELYGTIAEESWFDDDITPQMFRDELFSASGPVTIWINSPGGDCIAASQIYSMLMDYKGDVTVKIDGVAASAASVIAMAGTSVLMAPTALMMIHNPMTMAFGDHGDMQKASLGWLRESIIFPTPQSQTNSIVVPGRNSPIRFSEALGRVSYQPRSFDMTFSMLGSRATFDLLVSNTVNRFAGQLVQVILSEDQTMYYVGTVEAEPSYDPLSGKGVLVLSCDDGDAYRYHVEQTEISLSGSGTVTLQNDAMPVVPVVTTTAETALAWQVGTDIYQKSVSAGTWEIPELELAEGTNSIAVTGEGTTTFTYREGRL